VGPGEAVRRVRKRERQNIWDLESDFYLHNARVNAEFMTAARPQYVSLLFDLFV
jgi:hypothetical protein